MVADLDDYYPPALSGRVMENSATGVEVYGSVVSADTEVVDGAAYALSELVVLWIGFMHVVTVVW